MSKIKSLKFATEAAITILRIDDMIKLAPEKREEGSYGHTVARGELQLASGTWSSIYSLSWYQLLYLVCVSPRCMDEKVGVPPLA